MIPNKRMTDSINELINDQGVCRTAPATLGLLIIKLLYILNMARFDGVLNYDFFFNGGGDFSGSPSGELSELSGQSPLLVKDGNIYTN